MRGRAVHYRMHPGNVGCTWAADFVSVDRDSGRLATLRMTPMRMRRMRLEHASSDDAEWLRSTLEHISRPFGTRVGTINGVLATIDA